MYITSVPPTVLQPSLPRLLLSTVLILLNFLFFMPLIKAMSRLELFGCFVDAWKIRQVFFFFLFFFKMKENSRIFSIDLDDWAVLIFALLEPGRVVDLGCRTSFYLVWISLTKATGFHQASMPATAFEASR